MDVTLQYRWAPSSVHRDIILSCIPTQVTIKIHVSVYIHTYIVLIRSRTSTSADVVARRARDRRTGAYYNNMLARPSSRTTGSERGVRQGHVAPGVRCREKIIDDRRPNTITDAGGGPRANGKLASFGILSAVNGSRCFRDGRESFTSHGPVAAHTREPYTATIMRLATIMRQRRRCEMILLRMPPARR